MFYSHAINVFVFYMPTSMKVCMKIYILQWRRDKLMSLEGITVLRIAFGQDFNCMICNCLIDSLKVTRNQTKTVKFTKHKFEEF